MPEIKQSIVIDLKGNLVRQSRRYSDSMRRFSRETTGSLRSVRQSVAKTDRSLTSMTRSVGLFAAAAGAAKLGRSLLDFEARLARLRTDAGITQEEVDGLRSEITRAAHLSDIRVPVEEVERGVQSVIELYGFSENLVRNVETIARVIQATGSGGEASGAFIVELFKQGITDAKELEKEIDKIVRIGQKGSFVFREQAVLGPRLFTAIPNQKPSEVSALAQITRSASGGSPEATTGIEALGRVLTDINKIKRIRKLGVQVFERDEGGKATTELRNINEILLDIIDKTNKNPVKISQVLGGDTEAMRVFKGLLIEGNVELLKRLRLIEADGETLREFSKIHAQTTKAITQDAGAKVLNYIESAALPELRKTALAFDSLEKGDVKGAARNIFSEKIDTPEERKAVQDLEKDPNVGIFALFEGLKKLSNTKFSAVERGLLGEANFQPNVDPRVAAFVARREAAASTDGTIAELPGLLDRFQQAVESAARLFEDMSANIHVDVSTQPNTSARVTSTQLRGVRVRTDNRGQLMPGIGTQR